MGDPVTMGIMGAGIGAMMDRDQPLRGAMLGGVGGFGGASYFGPAIQGAQTANGIAALNSIGGAQAAGGMMSLNPTAPAIMTGPVTGGMSAVPATGLNAIGASPIAGGMSSIPVNPSQYLGNMAGGTTMASHATYQPTTLQKGVGLISDLPSLSGDSEQMMQAGSAMSKMGAQPQPQQPMPIVGAAPQMQMPMPGGQNFNREEEEERRRQMAMSYAQPMPSYLPGYGR